MAGIPLISMRNIVKRFPGVTANDQINLDLHSGQIHALLGENGSGKTTLMSILTGLYRPTEGFISVCGEEKKFASPRDAIDSGIGMVHQHFKLIESFTVAENIALSQSSNSFLLSQEEVVEDIEKLGEKYGMSVNPRSYVWQLSVGEKQRVEILRMLYRNSKVLILDEPTAVLTPQETKELFLNLRKMANDGCAVVFISHKLNEVLELADKITVLRAGKVAGCFDRNDTNRYGLIEMMIGRKISVAQSGTKGAALGETVLEIDDISALNDVGTLGLNGLSLKVRAGEIYGIAGVSGNGQRELAEVLAGLRPVKSGNIKFYGEEITGMSPKNMIERGISYVPEDRLGMGLVPSLNSCENVILKEYDKPKYSQGWWIKEQAAVAATKAIVEKFDVRMGSIFQPVKMMSGGNLQKLLLGREIASKPKLMIVLYPVRGLDIGAIESVHKLLLQLKEANTAIILVSEELEEIAELSDRVGVIFSGKILGEFLIKDLDMERVGSLMAGVVEDKGESV
ncbi:Autoinducer 2 import ATP-binding protein LsrA [bioreactor metagenome]|uniref:Autoinducer 2 import ATP-binding protein LsrA n=1 Tax=bioreactor metagenome TaxID=1076179 RepID=A0A644W4X8_9ZZZZ|nr:ABC transporter ATP-binding protein [Acidaminococcaceae bacterium]